MSGTTSFSEDCSEASSEGSAEPSAEPLVLTSRRNPLVARLRELHTPAGRSRQGLLLLEGTHLVQEVVRLRLQPELLLATPAWCAGHRDLLACLPAATQLRQATAAVLEAAARGMEVPESGDQGIAAAGQNQGLSTALRAVLRTGLRKNRGA